MNALHLAPSVLPTSRARLGVIALALLAGCGGANQQRSAVQKPGAKAPWEPPVPVGTSRLVPDLAGTEGVQFERDGETFHVVDRMRVARTERGTIRRAKQLLPAGEYFSRELPERLGGGFLFYVVYGGRTHLYRAKTFLGDLVPLVRLSTVTRDIVVGFDRLYAKTQNGQTVGIDPNTGQSRGLGPLPPSPSFGSLAFADGWRALVEADLRGVLATSDAGTTWKPIAVDRMVNGVTVVDGEPTVCVTGGRYVLEPRGNLVFHDDSRGCGFSGYGGYRYNDRDGDGINDYQDKCPDQPEDYDGVDDTDGCPEWQSSQSKDRKGGPKGPLGNAPLRLAIARGWPDTPNSIVVANKGQLVRVTVPEGEIALAVKDAYPDAAATCNALRFGPTATDFGFVCTEAESKTVVYRHERLTMTAALRLKTARRVEASGNGWLAIEGACTDDAPAPPPKTATYCIVDPFGTTREFRVKGDVGVERVVALSDGRTAVLVPPRGETPGQIAIVSGTSIQTKKLVLPAEPKEVLRELKRGMWLRGFEQRGKDAIGGWVEAGGAIVGVSVSLDGKVKAGEVRYDEDGALVSGRFGLVEDTSGSLAETVDGGLTWTNRSLPEHAAPRRSELRGCGPAGCVIGGWMRVGWGDPAEGDLDEVSPAQDVSEKRTPVAWKGPPTLECEHVGTLPPAPPPAKPPAMAKMPEQTQPQPHYYHYYRRYEPGRWLPFQNKPAPPITSSEIGFDNGNAWDTIPSRVYVWGKPGPEWAKTQRWQLRFDDPFDPTGGVRASNVGTSTYTDVFQAAEAVNQNQPRVFMDPGGRGAIMYLGWQVGNVLVNDGQAPIVLKDPAGYNYQQQPFAWGAVKAGDSWYFLTNTWANGANETELRRVDATGVARRVTGFRRVNRYGYGYGYNSDTPILVRRVKSGRVGLLLPMATASGERRTEWIIFPVNTATGELEDPVTVPMPSADGSAPQRCPVDRDGWLLASNLESPFPLTIPHRLGWSPQLARLRVDAGYVCVESLSTRAESFEEQPPMPPVPIPLPPGVPQPPAAAAKPGKLKPVAADAIPYVATLRSNGERRIYECRPKAPSLLGVLGVK